MLSESDTVVEDLDGSGGGGGNFDVKLGSLDDVLENLDVVVLGVGVGEEEEEKRGDAIGEEEDVVSADSEQQLEERESEHEDLDEKEKPKKATTTDEKEDVEEEEEEEVLTKCQLFVRILALSFTSAAYSIPWSLQIGYSSPYLESLSLPERFISMTWLAAPISGVILGLSVSAISDAVFIPLFGRRRPLILFGSILLGLALAIFPNSHVIGDGWNHVRSQACASISFIVLDFAVTFVTIALNTLTIDVIPAPQQILAVSMTTLGGGLGNFFGFGLGVIPWIDFLPYASVNFQPLCTVSLVVYLLFVSLTCLLLREEKDSFVSRAEAKRRQIERVKKESLLNANEKKVGEAEEGEGQGDEILGDVEMVEIPLGPSPPPPDVMVGSPVDDIASVTAASVTMVPSKASEGDDPLVQPLPPKTDPKKNKKKKCYDFLLVLRHLNCSYWGAFLTLFFTFVSKYFAYIFIAQFVGGEVFGGSALAMPGTPPRDKYEEGVRWSNTCLVVLAIVSMAYSPILALLARCVPVKILWAVGQFLLGVSFTVVVIFPTKWTVFGICAIFGVIQATMATLPWSVMNVVCRENPMLHDHKAFVSGVFYLAVCIPEILVATFGGYLSELLTDVFHLPFRFIFAFAAGFGWISFVAALLVPIPKGLQIDTEACRKRCRRKPLEDEDEDEDGIDLEIEDEDVDVDDEENVEV